MSAARDCPLDVVFVMDESGSVGENNYDEMKDFVSEIVGNLDIDSGNTQVGIVTFSDNVNTAIELDDYSTAASLQSAIAALNHAGGGTRTDRAFEYVRTTILTEAAGDRSDVPNVVIVLTDGQSNEPALTEVGALQTVPILTPSTPAVPNCCCSEGSAPHWSNAPFLIFDIRALWRSGLSARAPECQKFKMVRYTSMPKCKA